MDCYLYRHRGLVNGLMSPIVLVPVSKAPVGILGLINGLLHPVGRTSPLWMCSHSLARVCRPASTYPTMMRSASLKAKTNGNLFIFNRELFGFFKYLSLHCFICRPSTVSEYVGIKPRIFVTLALAVCSLTTRLDLLHSQLDLVRSGWMAKNY